MANKKISYTTRDFQQIRTELINFTRTYYPDVVENFNDASIFSALLDLNAAVTDNLQFNIDRSIQETVLQFAQQKSSIYNIARTYGLKIPGQRPSVAVVEFTIRVLAFGDAPDSKYLGVLQRGAQVNGGGQVFETVNNIDFASDLNSEGFTNRTVVPIRNAEDVIQYYDITKQEVVVNGITKVFKRTITANDIRPFFELFLPERNVLSVTSVLLKDGTNYASVPTTQEFLGRDNRWYEVRSLVEDRIFVEDSTKVSDNPGIKVGTYIQTTNKFITEYTPEGYLKMTFGGGTQSADEQLIDFARNGIQLDLYKYSNNLGLGSTLKTNTTLFIQYRVGGGTSSNLGVNAITQIGTINLFVNGPSQIENSNVINSLTVKNTTAAIGGSGVPTTEEIRNYVAFNFAAQNRAVTINDYNSLLKTMPSQFGAPAKAAILEENNKIRIKVLSFESSGALSELVSNTLLNNIANYLSNYRMINDYISIESGSVIDLGLEIFVTLDNSINQGDIITKIINITSNFFSPSRRNMGENIFISELKSEIQNQNGVISISDINVFNKVGGQYSSSQTSQSYIDNETRQIRLVDEALFTEPSQIYQIRFPRTDILVRVRNLSTVSFS